MKKSISVLLVMLMVGSLLFAAGAQETKKVDVENWPTEAIIVTCPWSAGGIADMSIRAMSKFGEKYFGQPMVPVVRTGAGGAVAITEFMKNPPNAPQLIMASEGLFAITPLTNDVAYSWDKYVPVIGNAYSAFALVSNSSSEFTTFEKLLEIGKTRPVTIAITGDNLLFVGAFFAKAGIEYKAVPYSGAPEQLAAVLSGDVDLGVTHPALAKEHVKAGKIKTLVVFDDKPWKDEFYNIAPITDYGFDIVFPNLNFFLMPGGTDPAIIEKVYAQISAIYAEPEFQALAKKLNIVIRPANRAEIEAHIDNAIEKAKEYNKIVYNK